MAPITESTSVVQLNAPTNFPIKLTASNFSVWSRQVQSTLIGLDLIGYIDGTLTAPAKFTDTAGTNPNPLYSIWYRQDQILISALLGSLSDPIQPTISTAVSSREAWTKLQAAYASTTPGRILSLKSQLAKNSRGTRSIAEYLKEMTDIADSLALAGHPVSETDLVSSVITQLGDEYQSVYSALRVRESAITMADLADILQDIERLLTTSTAAPPLIPTAQHTNVPLPFLHFIINPGESQPTRHQDTTQRSTTVTRIIFCSDDDGGGDGDDAGGACGVSNAPPHRRWRMDGGAFDAFVHWNH
ncbi:hypothetical protein OROMI_025292 [Orobanche minor]